MLSCSEFIFNKLTIFIMKEEGRVHGSRASQLRGNIHGAPVKSYLKLIRDVPVHIYASSIYVHSRKRAGMPSEVTSDCDGTTQRKLPRDGGGRPRVISAFDIDSTSCTSQQENLPRAIDRRLKIYGFMVLIGNTSEHTARVSGATARGVVSNYGRCTPTALGGSPNRAGEGLRHGRSELFVIVDFTLYLAEIIGKLYRFRIEIWRYCYR